MVDDKMCFGTYKGGLMARVEPTEIAVLTERLGATQMIHGGRPMTGYVFVEAEGLDAEDDLAFWIEKCLAFNPKLDFRILGSSSCHKDQMSEPFGF